MFAKLISRIIALCILYHYIYFLLIASQGLNLNPPPNLDIITEINGFWQIPDHQQGIRCKSKIPLAAGAPRSEGRQRSR
jgi:hypothetical protein